MIKINNNLIHADTLDMLNTLKSELASKGIDRFHMFRNNGSNIQTNCPFHKQGQERKPSFGVNGELNKCHCFTCGWSGSINDMISELFGYYDNGKYGEKWLIRHFNTLEIETRINVLEDKFKRTRNDLRALQAYITEEELDSYRYIHPYMYKRGLTDEIIEEFDIGYNRDNDCITFPILDINGNCVFVATRSTKTKFFGLPKEINKPIYQAYRFKDGKYKEAFITESFLNCLTCWKYGVPAMAMIGTGNKSQYDILRRLPVRSYVLAFDPDDAGRKATQRFKQFVSNKLIYELDYKEDGKDINDLQERFLELKKIL